MNDNGLKELIFAFGTGIIYILIIGFFYGLYRKVIDFFKKVSESLDRIVNNQEAIIKKLEQKQK